MAQMMIAMDMKVIFIKSLSLMEIPSRTKYIATIIASAVMRRMWSNLVDLVCFFIKKFLLSLLLAREKRFFAEEKTA
jgi:hypothetical protein